MSKITDIVRRNRYDEILNINTFKKRKMIMNAITKNSFSDMLLRMHVVHMNRDILSMFSFTSFY